MDAHVTFKIHTDYTKQYCVCCFNALVSDLISQKLTIGCNSRVLTVTGVLSLVADVYRPELALLFASTDEGYFVGEIDLGGDGKRSLFTLEVSSFITPN